MPQDEQDTEFEKAGQEKQLSLAREFLVFISETKKWWLVPILLVLGMLGLLVALGSTGCSAIYLHIVLRHGDYGATSSDEVLLNSIESQATASERASTESAITSLGFRV